VARGASGRVAAAVTAVLRYLAARHGQLVTEEELLKRLWPGIYVTKTVLPVCVHAIRQAVQE
jgi:DNA-binding winged helix-turn-helix (wHTH) protein